MQLMHNHRNAFRIYDASAGSGKTFTLAREYLVLLLRSDARLSYRKILAITFTNKAVGELKARIRNSLMEFSALKEGQEIGNAMFVSVQKVLGTDSRTLIERSRRVLQELLHNYAFFDVSTIDKFNHRILRTFAQDLNLSPNFEVVLDTDRLLLQAVDALVARAGSHRELTNTLIEFALEKAAEDRHWDISRDLFEMGRLLFDENHYAYLEDFSQKEFEDFAQLRRVLGAKRKQSEEELVRLAEEVLAVIRDNQLEESDFSRGYFPKFIAHIAGGAFDQDFEAGWKRDFGQKPLYPKKTPARKQELLDDLLPLFTVLFHQIRREVYHLNFLVNAYQNIAPFTVLGMLQKELDILRDEEGFLPISSFNAIISKELKDQPAPYIYERLGERYRHYFIDEFQDTSRLQWTNLVPLISNALQGEDEQGERGSLVLVGDPKQAIYRWRGGKAEQFLNLADGSGNPFAMEASLEALPRNFRSHRQVIEFNNDFFAHISRYMSREAYSELFLNGANQQHEKDEPGMVCLDFIPAGTDSPSTRESYLLKTQEIIEDLQNKGYAHRDICILTRRKKEGVLLSRHLMKIGIPVISSETLLLKNHPGVQFLIHLLNYLQKPEDKNHAFGVLLFLSGSRRDRHDWITARLQHLGPFLAESYGFDVDHYRLKPVYEILEDAICQFHLAGSADAYLIYLMDVALEAGRQDQQSVQAFLEYWNAREEEISILSPEGFDAVTLMTIHKSKGLEFPIVIYPFADTSIYWERNPKIWLPVQRDDFAGFRHIMVGKKKALQHYEDPAPAYYQREREKQELDAFNLLYVAHTRAVEGLFIISRARGQNDAPGDPQSYGDLYTGYLRHAGLWEEGRERYCFGMLDANHIPAELTPGDKVSLSCAVGARGAIRVVTKSGQLWDSEQEKALTHGNILHHALSFIKTSGDIDAVLDQMISEGQFPREDGKEFRDMLRSVVEHPLLVPFFKPGLKVLNEQEILTENGLILRPDRLVFDGTGVSVIDYKTGQRRPGHREQVLEYSRALEETGHSVETAIIIYITGQEVTPEFI